MPGATAGIYGIRQAGLAISVGTWSSLVVVSSFIWGIGVFREGVKSVPGAFAAMLLLCSGLGGMARYSHPPVRSKEKDMSLAGAEDVQEIVPLTKDDSIGNETNPSPSSSVKKLDPIAPGRGVAKRKAAPQSTDPNAVDVLSDPSSLSDLKQKADIAPLEIEAPFSSVDDHTAKDVLDMLDAKIAIDKDTVVLFKGRIVMTRRELGILGAVFNGTWGGTSLIPLHYAKAQGFGGAAYVISFACGSLLVLVLVWMLRYLFNLYRCSGKFWEAYRALPSFHLREMWAPGCLSGTLYSIGNFSSIIATTYLGQGVGYSLCQSSLIISGIWGIFFFREINGVEAISKWFGCAFITLAGILWLSYEHKGEGIH